MNGDDEIQARREEEAKWTKELADARAAYQAAYESKHVPGCISFELNAMREASKRIVDAKFKLDWLRWCDEMDEGRWRESDGSI